MTYATIMVHLDAARSNEAVLGVTAALAARHGARVIGIASCQPVQLGYSDGYMSGDMAILERDIVDERLRHAKTEFHDSAALAPYVLEWRSIPTLANIAHIVADEARSSDLIVVGAPAIGVSASHADIGDLVIRAGRPVLVVPDASATTEFRTVLVAWKDARECRRAIVDALPLLRTADRIIIAEVAANPAAIRAQTADIMNWLSRQGLGADRIVLRADHDDAATIATIAADHDADLIVAGAYGHSRLEEWAFGGVTRDLLLRGSRCGLLSH